MGTNGREIFGKPIPRPGLLDHSGKAMTPTPISLVFDDGFRRSCEKISAIFEAHGLSAVFAVSALPPAPQEAFGDWRYWQELRSRGHHIHPHGWDHANLARLTPDEAIENCRHCLAVYADEGFSLDSAIFHYPYNQGTPALHEWLLRRVRSVRIGGSGFNSPADLASRVLHCTAHGPGSGDEFLMAKLEAVRVSRPALCIVNLHGLDGEGWGPISSATLDRTLRILRDDPELCYSDLSEINASESARDSARENSHTVS